MVLIDFKEREVKLNSNTSKGRIGSKTTRTKPSSGSLMKRADGRWEGRVTVGYDPMTGKQKRKSVYGHTKSEARKKLSAIMNEIDEGTYQDVERIKVNQWLDIWLDEFCGDKKPLSMQKYRGTLNQNVRPYIGNKYLDKLTTMDVQRLYNYLANPKTGRGLNPKTVKDVHSMLRRSLEIAIRNGLIKENPCNGTILPHIPKVDVNPLTNDQIQDFLVITGKDPIYGTFYQVALFTGMRKSEVMGLTWDNVDFEHGIIYIQKQLQQLTEKNGGYQFTSLKNNKVRSIRPAAYVMNLLRIQYQEQMRHAMNAGSSWLAWTDENSHRTALVFTDEIGQHLKQQTVYKRYKAIVTEMGIPERRLHDLRHTFAVVCIENGDDIKTVQCNLGHASSSFTLDVYGHLSESMKTASSERMESFIDGLTAKKANAFIPEDEDSAISSKNGEIIDFQQVIRQEKFGS